MFISSDGMFDCKVNKSEWGVGTLSVIYAGTTENTT